MNIKKSSSLLFCLMFYVCGCSNNETGNLVSGIYKFENYSETMSFYEIFKNKNEERFIIPDFDNEYQNSQYFFQCGGVDAKIINDKIYDYDFPSPSFSVSTLDFEISSLNVENLQDTIKNDSSIEIVAIKDTASLKRVNLYYSEIEIAYITFINSIDENEINKICEILKGSFENVF